MNKYPLGAVVQLKDLITDQDTGLPVDDATEALTIYKPDGTSSLPTVAPGATGHYSATITVDQAGFWTYTWRATGTGAGAGGGGVDEAGRFWVMPPPL
jgi:hypothetical protein